VMTRAQCASIATLPAETFASTMQKNELVRVTVSTIAV
jgi:hypothetical protein